MAKKKITLTALKAMQPGETLWDTELRGFGCRYRREGAYFVLKYTLHGRQRFYTIGRWDGGLTPEQARKQAMVLREEINKGIDPMAEKEKLDARRDVRALFDLYLAEVKEKRSPRTHESYLWLYDTLICPRLGSYKVDAVTRADIARLHSDLKDTPYKANRALAVLSAFFSWCDKRGYRTDTNPCRHVDKYKEQARERFLSEAELCRLGQAIAWYEAEHAFLKPQPHKKGAHGPQEPNPVTLYATAAIRLLILTGARRNEILTLRWADVHFDLRLIRLQESKTGQKTIYLNAPALQLLSEMPRLEGNPYVICGAKDGARLVNIKAPWGVIRARAGLDDVRLHDLRHSYASTAVAAGHHLKVIGSLLGHADTHTTERYAHLANDPLQAASEDIGRKLGAALAGGRESDNVVPLKG